MPFRKGHPGYTPKLSKDHKRKISEALKGIKRPSGKDNPMWKGERPPCSVCGKTLTKHYSWLTKEQLAKKKCRDCFGKTSVGEGNPNWKGGRYILKSGYIGIFIGSDKSYKLEHDLVMENHLGRKLVKDEVVHHINGIKNDNRIENLELMSNYEHSKMHGDRKKSH